jgi:hypothetical protein
MRCTILLPHTHDLMCAPSCKQQAKVLATYVSQMEQGCRLFVDTHIKGKEDSVIAMYEPIRAFFIEMSLRLILGLGDTAPETVSICTSQLQFD